MPGGRRALRGAIARSGAQGVGAEALSAARELRPHLILLDVYLPDMTGLEVLQRLRSEGDRVGVIMITAARELDTVSGALDAGADQSLIDTLFGWPGSTADEALPKGLGAETGRLVLDAVRKAGEVSAAECADLVGISRVSARRYLEHYLSAGALELRLHYGVGRPERRYRSAR
ncbi:response regulator [Mycobacterium sp.]|uniref:response regulator n=1 Tax=Mycobacterium sp. TaxID=1785 RepID=UPI0039C8E008